MQFKTKFLVKIYFKSGNSYETWFDEVSAKYSGDELKSLEWNFHKAEQNIFWSLKDVEFVQIVKKSRYLVFK